MPGNRPKETGVQRKWGSILNNRSIPMAFRPTRSSPWAFRSKTSGGQRINPRNAAPIQTLGRLAGSCLQVYQALKRRGEHHSPAGPETPLSLPTVTVALNRLGETGLVTELTGRRRNRVFSYPRYLEILGEGQEFDFRQGCRSFFGWEVLTGIGPI